MVCLYLVICNTLCKIKLKLRTTYFSIGSFIEYSTNSNAEVKLSKNVIKKK